MKKILVILIGMFFAVGLSAQQGVRYEWAGYGGIYIGGDYTTRTPASAARLDSLIIVDDTYKLYNGATQLAPDIPSGNMGNLPDYAVMLLPDTLHLAASDTLDATYNGADVSFTTKEYTPIMNGGLIMVGPDGKIIVIQ